DEIFNVTIRVQVVDDLGNVGEDRKVVAVHSDPDLKPGFPLEVAASGESSPTMADLDGNGVLDLIVATADGKVHAFSGGTTSELPGWPVTTDLDVLHTGSAAFTSAAVSTNVHESILASVAVGDLEENGSLEVFVASTQGKLYAFSAPAIRNEANRLDPGFFATPALADLDRDGKLEIVIGAMDRHLYVFRA